MYKKTLNFLYVLLNLQQFQSYRIIFVWFPFLRIPQTKDEFSIYSYFRQDRIIRTCILYIRHEYFLLRSRWVRIDNIVYRDLNSDTRRHRTTGTPYVYFLS